MSEPQAARNPPTLDFVSFHEEELPRRIAAGHGRHAFAASRTMEPLALRVTGGDAYTYVPRDGTIEVRRGADGAGIEVEIGAEDFADLVCDMASGPGLLYPGRVRVVRGEPRRFLDWEAAWRALYQGRPVFEPEAIDLRDRDGAPLELRRSFDAGDDEGAMAHFFRTAGFLHVRRLFDGNAVAALRAAAHRSAARATEDDGNSWWGITRSGEKRLTRVLDAREEPDLQALAHDPRLARLVDLLGVPLVPDVDGEAVTVLFKVRDVVEGLANLPWHRDCGMGGHAIQCPTVNVSIFLTAANRETGGLWILPGSAPYGCPASLFERDEPRGSILLEAGPGDVTLHTSDTLHAAFAPTGDGPLRESLIVTWKPPGARPHDGQNHYNDAIKGEGGLPRAGRAAPGAARSGGGGGT